MVELISMTGIEPVASTPKADTLPAVLHTGVKEVMPKPMKGKPITRIGKAEVPLGVEPKAGQEPTGFTVQSSYRTTVPVRRRG